VASLPTYSRDPAEITPRGARLVLNAPDGRYASAVHEIETEIKRRRSHDASRLILVVSALPREGAEELASNLAHSLAISGSAALLVDADLRLKPLTRLLAPQAASGLLDQIVARRPIDEAILRDQTTGLFFLPASGHAPTPLSVPSALRAPEFASAMRGLRHGFSTIVVAAPPALPVSDARIIAELADDIVFVTAWHRTPRRLAAKALASLAADQKKLLGTVLTGIDDRHALEPMSFAEIFSELRQAALVNIAARAA
jgi:Mrp family chromosome partitioning ATPase